MEAALAEEIETVVELLCRRDLRGIAKADGRRRS
jgi:hypothetical protein